MALIKCVECGKEISDKANTCINCGYPIKIIKEKETNNIKRVYSQLSKEEIRKIEEKMNEKGVGFNSVSFIFLLIIIFRVISLCIINYFWVVDDIENGFGIIMYHTIITFIIYAFWMTYEENKKKKFYYSEIKNEDLIYYNTHKKDLDEVHPEVLDDINNDVQLIDKQNKSNFLLFLTIIILFWIIIFIVFS